MSITIDEQRIASGNISFASTELLTDFFYLLMRDHIPSGELESLVRVAESTDLTQQNIYTNGWLAKYAHHLAGRFEKAQDLASNRYFNPKPVVNAILEKDYEPLLIERADGGWAFPGGYQERESLYQALAREVREEVGLEVDESPESWKFIHIATTRENTINSMFFLYLKEIDWSKLSLSKEVKATRFVKEPEKLVFESHTRALELSF